jgi:hypothetical protein
MEGEEGGAEEGQVEDQERGTGEEGDDDDEEKEASGEEPVDPWGDMPLAHIFDLTSFDNFIRSRTRSVTGIVPPCLVEVRLALPASVETTGLLLRRIQLVCDSNLKFEDEGPSTEDSTGTPNVVARRLTTKSMKLCFCDASRFIAILGPSARMKTSVTNLRHSQLKHTQQPGHRNEVSTKSKMRTRT